MTIQELIEKYELERNAILRELIEYESVVKKTKLKIYEEILNDLYNIVEE